MKKKLLLVFLPLFAGCVTFLIAQNPTNILILSLLLFPYLLFVVGTASVFCWQLTQKHITFGSILSILISVSILLGFLSGSMYEKSLVKKYETNEGVIDAEIVKKIAGAIEKYKSSTHKYPESLNNLVPEYLEEIPSTARGKDFFYSHYTNSQVDYFMLCYPDLLFGKCFDSLHGKIVVQKPL